MCRKIRTPFWRNTIGKEVLNVGTAFEVLLTGEKVPPGWNKVTGNLVFGVKMDFQEK